MIILTETQEEFKQMIKIADKEAIPFHSVYRPEDSVARVVWSIEDIRDVLPEETSDEELFEALKHVEKGIKSTATAAGWEAIETLKDEMINHIN